MEVDGWGRGKGGGGKGEGGGGGVRNPLPTKFKLLTLMARKSSWTLKQVWVPQLGWSQLFGLNQKFPDSDCNDYNPVTYSSQKLWNLRVRAAFPFCVCYWWLWYQVWPFVWSCSVFVWSCSIDSRKHFIKNRLLKQVHSTKKLDLYELIVTFMKLTTRSLRSKIIVKVYNLGHNFLELYNVLIQTRLTTSKTKRDI